MLEEYKPDPSQWTKAIVYGTGKDENISLDLSMGFPTYLLVGIHTKDCSMGYQIFPGIISSEEVRKKESFKSCKTRGQWLSHQNPL